MDPPLTLLQFPVQAGKGLLVGLSQGDVRSADFSGSLAVKLLQAHQFDLLMLRSAETEQLDQGRVANAHSHSSSSPVKLT